MRLRVDEHESKPSGMLGAPPSSRAVTDLWEASAGVILRLFVVLHVVVWTALPTLLTHTLPQDVVEGLAWGQEWQLGYFKHPPLQAWLLESVAWLSGHAPWALYLLSQLCVAISFWAVWRLARLVVSPLGALISALLLEGVIFFNYPTPEFNPNVVQLPFWALAGWSFYRALRFGRVADWAVLGLWLALSTYGKYATAVLGIAMVGFMLAEPQARRSWRTVGPYVTAALYVVLLLPHLWWAVDQNFPTVEHFYSASEPTRGVGAWLVALLVFAGGQLAVMAPAGLLVAALAGIGDRAHRLLLCGGVTRFDRRFVAALAFGPFLASIVASAVTGRGFLVDWGYPMWCFIGLFAVIFLAPVVSQAGLRRFGHAWVGLFVSVAVIYAGVVTLLPYARQDGVSGVTTRLFSRHLLDRQQQPRFPGPELAREITRQWHAEFGDRLAYVIGNKWIAGNVAFFSPDRPSVFLAGNPHESPWIDMASLFAKGAVVLWDPEHNGKEIDDKLDRRFPMMVKQPTLVLPWDTGAALPPVRIEWAIIPPRSAPTKNSSSTGDIAAP